MKRLAKCAIASIAILVSGCADTTTPATATETATEAEICRQIGARLPTRSRRDTARTQDEVQALYAAFALTCPAWEHLIP